jgi:hypothetical protein
VSTVTLPVKVTTTRSKTKSSVPLGESTEELRLPKEVTVPKTELAYARFGVSQTINLGNYESLRLEVSVEIPTPSDDVVRAIERAKEIAVRKLVEFRSEALGEKHE